MILHEYPESGDFKGNLVVVQDIQPGSTPTESTLPADRVIRRNLLVSSNVLGVIRDIASRKLQSPGGSFREAIVQLTVHYLYYMNPARFDPEATEEARAQAAGDVEPPMYRSKKGEVLVQKGDVITSEKYRALEFYNQAMNRDRIGRVAALFIQQVLLVALLLYLSMRFARHKLDDVSGNMMLYLVVWSFGLWLFFVLNIWHEDPARLELSSFFGSFIPIGFFCSINCFDLWRDPGPDCRMLSGISGFHCQQLRWKFSAHRFFQRSSGRHSGFQDQESTSFHNHRIDHCRSSQCHCCGPATFTARSPSLRHRKRVQYSPWAF